MGKEKNAAANPFFHLLRELFQFGIYKRSQGRIARQVTWGALFAVMAMGALRLYDFMAASETLPRTLVPCGVLLAGSWIAYRLVNMPSFADFLIAVEAEMNKVSWPTLGELWRSLLVVLFSIGFLVLVLASYDLFWRLVLHFLKIVG